MPLAQRHTVDERIERQGTFCAAMGSQLGGALLRAVARDMRAGGVMGDLFERYPEIASPPRAGIRVLAALHACALDGDAPELAAHLPSCGGDGDSAAAWAAAAAYVARAPERFAALCARTPQTNEVARATPLLGGLLAAVERHPQPVRLLEIGASAGLNTRLDTYRYEGSGWSWGDASSPLVLRNRERGGSPASLDARLRVAERAACDLHPLDVSREADRAYLRSFVWPDQIERLQRLDDACAAAARTPLVVERAEAIEWMSDRFHPQSGVLTVLMHSVVTYYLTTEQREALHASVARAFAESRADAPVAWLRMEVTEAGGVTRLAFAPGEDVVIARSDGHGQSLQWSAR